MHFAKSFIACAVAVILVSACGGGSEQAVIDNGLSSNTLSPGSFQAVTPGQSIPISAKALFRGSNVLSMTWTVQSLQISSSQSFPTLSNGACTAITLTPASTAGSTSQGYCEAVLSIPVASTTGSWRVVNTAVTADGKSKSSSFDVSVQSLATTKFSLIEQLAPANGQIGTLVSMNAPFVAQEGNTLADVAYSWVAVAGNPAAVSLTGKTSSTATFKPTVAGQYTFNVTAKALVNGTLESAAATYILLVTQKSTDPTIVAGDITTKVVNSVVKLQGAITNRDATSNYTSNWMQIVGDQGGPARVVLANELSSGASFVPTVAGTYGFTYSVTQTTADGVIKVVSANTQVIVTSNGAAIYNISAGDAQVGALGAVITLIGTVSDQGGSPSYQWVQTAGPSIVLSNANTTKATFIPTVEGSYTFNFVVSTASSAGTTSVSSNTQVVVK